MRTGFLSAARSGPNLTERSYQPSFVQEVASACVPDKGELGPTKPPSPSIRMDQHPSSPGTAPAAEKLSRILHLDESAEGELSLRELPALLTHQLGAPLMLDLWTCELREADVGRERLFRLTAESGIYKIRDLLTHKSPHIESFRAAKEFFKQGTQLYARDSAEWQIAYLFYILVLVSSGPRLAEISRLSPSALSRAAAWALSQPWLSPEARTLLASTRPR